MVGGFLDRPVASYDVAMPQVSVRGFDLDYDVAGDGSSPPLIWGHGLTSSRGISAAYPLVDLKRAESARQVVRYDTRGHGLSSIIDDPKMGSWAELALDQMAFIDHLGFDRVVLGGVSMGAGTALHSALVLRDRLDKMVLVIPPTAWEERSTQVDLYEQMARVVETRGPKALIAASAELAPPDPFAGTSDHADRRAGSLGSADPARLAACFRGAVFADLPPLDDIATITAPTLVLAWSGDPGHPVSTAEKLRDTLPDVQVSIASTRAGFDSWSDQLHSFLA
jgi:pimeloyl-ACP methyl ester carboxylesterase